MTAIVFSKDRAMQLDALLRSYKTHVTSLRDVCVLYTASTLRHVRAYREVFSAHKHATPFAQSDSFKTDLLQLIPEDSNVVFFVDDQVFTRPWTVVEESGLSLRLGLHLTYDYAYGSKHQPLPLHRIFGDRVSWNWREGEGSWGYPLSLDGHVFEAKEMRGMIEAIDFHSPNTLEAGLQAFVSCFLPRRGTCYRESKIVNVPWNIVQTDWHNRNAGLSAEDLLSAWEAGMQIDLSGIYGVLNESVHQEFPLKLVPRC
jgi:hypothetical protein